MAQLFDGKYSAEDLRQMTGSMAQIAGIRLGELALEAGAEDVRNEGEVYEVLTSPVAFHKVKDAVSAKAAIEAAEITYLPQNTVAIDAEAAQKLLKLVDALEDNDDVQSVSHNAEVPESVVV